MTLKDVIQRSLDELAELKDAANVQRLTWEAKRDEIIAPYKAQLAELDAEFEPQMQEITEKIAKLEAEVRTNVLTYGESIKGKRLHAIWTKGRVSWDSKKLDGLMIAFPELRECRTEGQPSVSLRNI